LRGLVWFAAVVLDLMQMIILSQNYALNIHLFATEEIFLRHANNFYFELSPVP